MVRENPLSDDLRAVILNMARHLDVPAIRHYTGCPVRTIRDVLLDYSRKGTILRHHRHKQTLRGKKQALTSANICVCAIQDHTQLETRFRSFPGRFLSFF